MKQFLRGIFPVALALISSLAHAQNDYWVNTGSGDFNTAANWSTQPPLSGIQGTSEVPNAGNIAVITPQGNSLIITQTNATNTIRGLEVNNSNGIFFFATGGTVTFTSASSTLTVNGVTNVAGEGDFAAADFFVDQGTDLVFNSPSNNGQLLVTNGRISIGDNLAPFAPTTGELDVNSGLVSFNPGLNSKTEVNIGDGLGASGTVTQGLAASSTSGALSSTVVTGNWFYIGLGGGDGSYSLVNNSILQTGTVNGSTAIIGLGVNSTSNTFLGGFGGGATGPGSTGNMTINDSSVVNIGNSTGTSKGDLQLGTTSVGSVLGGGSGTITQSGTGSAVNIFGGSSMEIGNSPGGTGSYNLAAGILNIGVAGTGVATLTVANNGAIGSLVQTGGTLVAGANSLVAIGKGTGTATYALTGGTANFENGFTLAGAGSSISQSGSTTLTAEGAVTLGGTSTYFMNGGSAIFSNTVDIATGASLGVNGGTFQVGEDNLEGVGDINYGGGTLKITTDSGLGTTLAYGFGGGVLSNGVSTIDASTSNLTAFNLANPFSGTGGISFIGNGGTVFQFTNDATNPNSYTGSTAINGGTLIVNGSDIANSSSLGIGSTGTLKLNLSNLAANATFDYAGSISGTGTLDVGFFNPGDTLALTNPTPGATSFTGNIVLGYNGTGGTLNIFNGTYGAISDDGTGSSVTIGTTTNSGIVNFTGPSTYTGTTTVFANYSLTALNLDGNVVNAGTLDVTGAAGINAGAGGLITNSGTLTSSAIVGNVGTSLANGNSGTLFTSSVSGNLFNSGTLSSTATLGTTPGVATVTIGGGLTSSGTLTFRDAGTVADLYDVTGAANLTGGGGSITGYGTTPAAGLTVLTSAATTGFTAGNYKVAGPGVLFTGEVTQVGNNLVLHTTENPAAPFAQ
ncbi:MAG TPA: hypothetical protein VL981_01480, partial [Candidatus Methylacidiphilales bacterium]|nr:hypothetical protein [Candidatus Methylacidiphilales bacterium]